MSIHMDGNKLASAKESLFDKIPKDQRGLKGLRPTGDSIVQTFMIDISGVSGIMSFNWQPVKPVRLKSLYANCFISTATPALAVYLTITDYGGNPTLNLVPQGIEFLSPPAQVSEFYQWIFQPESPKAEVDLILSSAQAYNFDLRAIIPGALNKRLQLFVEYVPIT